MRAMVSTVVNNNTSPLVENALAMLKPGGYLQWTENEPTAMHCGLPSADFEAPSTNTLVNLHNVLTRVQSKIEPEWLYNLSSTLMEKGCEVVVSEVQKAKKELSRAMTDNYLLVWRGECTISSVLMYQYDLEVS
jgi:hypothetical protein